MNQEQLERVRMENMEKVDIYRMSHRFGCVRINCHNSLRHEIAKLKEVYKALKEGQKVATECISKDGKRKFDFINFDSGEVKEFETDPKVKKSRAITVEI